MSNNLIPESFHNGMSANEGPTADLDWQKSQRSNHQGQCVEVAKLPDGGVAMRNSRFTDGPALIFTKAEMEAFLGGVQDGDFAYLIA